MWKIVKLNPSLHSKKGFIMMTITKGFDTKKDAVDFRLKNKRFHNKYLQKTYYIEYKPKKNNNNIKGKKIKI